MTPFEYMFSSTKSLSDIDIQQTKVLSNKDVPAYAMVSAPVGNCLAFYASTELKRWAFYKLDEDNLAIASPFGCIHLPFLGMDGAKGIGLIAIGSKGAVSTWKVKADNRWRDVNGVEASDFHLKAKKLADGSFEPLHALMSFRGIDSKPCFWAVVLLPNLPERIYSKDGGVRIEAGGRIFSLPLGTASGHVMAGRVQWGLPDEDGFFVLQPRLC